MTKELEKRLEEEFPFMKKGKSLKEQEEVSLICVGDVQNGKRR